MLFRSKWAIKRLGILGFSAGGHLAVSVGTHVDKIDREATDSIDCESCRPDFLVPIYAVTNGIKRGRKADEYTPADTNVSANTPPTFLVHTHEDRIVSPAQSVLFYEAMLNAGVQCELISMATANTAWGSRSATRTSVNGLTRCGTGYVDPPFSRINREIGRAHV